MGGWARSRFHYASGWAPPNSEPSFDPHVFAVMNLPAPLEPERIYLGRERLAEVARVTRTLTPIQRDAIHDAVLGRGYHGADARRRSAARSEARKALRRALSDD